MSQVIYLHGFLSSPQSEKAQLTKAYVEQNVKDVILHIPQIPNTIDKVADDVHQDRLAISPDHQRRDPEDFEVAILNSKGFGGNNATAVVLSPARTEAMLARRHGRDALRDYVVRREHSERAAEDYCRAADDGDYAPIYRFGEGMIEDAHIHITRERISIDGLVNPIELPVESPYGDML